MLNVHGTVDLYVEDAIDMAHGGVHSYWLDMDGYSSSAYDGDMKVGNGETKPCERYVDPASAATSVILWLVGRVWWSKVSASVNTKT